MYRLVSEGFVEQIAQMRREISATVYDSLGEAYLSDGNKELAINNYRRSAELDPKNTNGLEALKKLQSGRLSLKIRY